MVEGLPTGFSAARVDNVKVARVGLALLHQGVTAHQAERLHVLHGAQQLLGRHLREEEVRLAGGGGEGWW